LLPVRDTEWQREARGTKGTEGTEGTVQRRQRSLVGDGVMGWEYTVAATLS